MIVLPVANVVYREDLYPRFKPIPEMVQAFAANIELLPPIEVNQDNILIDGWHRWNAHRKAGAETIQAIVTHTRSDRELLIEAGNRNASGVRQLGESEKARLARDGYDHGSGWLPEHRPGAATDADGKPLNEPARLAWLKRELAAKLKWSVKSVTDALAAVDNDLREARSAKIRSMWLSCHTQQEIADAVGLTKETVSAHAETCQNLEAIPKSDKLAALFEDADWKPPLYDLWNQAKNTNHEHFGNSPQEFVENLLYLYTEPFGIVVDPFAGGGSTIDVCQKRSRRYWVSDRAPIVEREAEIRQHDLVTSDGSVQVSGPFQWVDVQLVYLDPPYWRQAAGEYSTDATDLGNMGLEQFTAALTAIVNGYAAKLKPGAHIALLIQPTQWKADDRAWPAYHDLDVIQAASKRLRLQYHIVCPYSTEQSNAQQVEDAKEHRRLLVRTRRLVVWEVIKPGGKDRLEGPELQQVASAGEPQ